MGINIKKNIFMMQYLHLYLSMWKLVKLKAS